MDTTDSPDWLIHAFLLHKRLKLLGNTTRQARMIGALVDLAKVASRMAYHLAEKPARDRMSQYSRIGAEVRDGMADFEGMLAGAFATFGDGSDPPNPVDADMPLDRMEETTQECSDIQDAGDYEGDYDDISPTQIVEPRSDGMSSPAPYPLGDFEAPILASAPPGSKTAQQENPEKLHLDAESMNRLVASLLPALEPSLVPAVAWFLKAPLLEQLSATLPALLLRDEALMTTLVQGVATRLEATQAPSCATSAEPDAQTRGQGSSSGRCG
ncbi:hypothetical protein K466DRAFT_568558 [Polyporus arcularius HHB13444]|uniref:Uncharacterized protein n=1 Tax=Polyporus arcularius HHB13444 TaxID=1314778 RepID=A0A5C3NXT9_9APHY|nr:hypothetical protein K466DRAFT_568558 [Polyporus arcularius HHB13444]